MVYLKDSFIVSSFLFMFIHNIALLQRLVAITIDVGVENPWPKKCLLPSFPETSSPDIYPLIELFDVLSCISSPGDSVNSGSISVSLHTSDIIFAV